MSLGCIPSVHWNKHWEATMGRFPWMYLRTLEVDPALLNFDPNILLKAIQTELMTTVPQLDKLDKIWFKVDWSFPSPSHISISISYCLLDQEPPRNNKEDTPWSPPHSRPRKRKLQLPQKFWVLSYFVALTALSTWFWRDLICALLHFHKNMFLLTSNHTGAWTLSIHSHPIWCLAEAQDD